MTIFGLFNIVTFVSFFFFRFFSANYKTNLFLFNYIILNIRRSDSNVILKEYLKTHVSCGNVPPEAAPWGK